MKKLMCVLINVLLPVLFAWAGGTSLVLEKVEGVAGTCTVQSYDVEPGIVNLKTTGGPVSVPIGSLSDSDREKVIGWATDQAFSRGLKVRIVEEKTDTESDSRQGLTGKEQAKANKNYTIREEETVTYTMKVQNKSDFELRNISFDYYMFFERETCKIGADDIKEKLVETGRKDFTLTPGEEISFDVPPLTLVCEENRVSGKQGGVNSVEENMQGILVVASYTGSMGEQLTCEFKDGRIPKEKDRVKYKNASSSRRDSFGGKKSKKKK